MDRDGCFSLFLVLTVKVDLTFWRGTFRHASEIPSPNESITRKRFVPLRLTSESMSVCLTSERKLGDGRQPISSLVEVASINCKQTTSENKVLVPVKSIPDKLNDGHARKHHGTPRGSQSCSSTTPTTSFGTSPNVHAFRTIRRHSHGYLYAILCRSPLGGY